MPSKARTAFDENAADVGQFLSIHATLAGTGKGRKHNVEILNRAAAVFICACWEAFVEDLVREAAAKLIAATTPLAAASVVQRRVDNALVRFNTPKADNVNALMKDALALDDVLKSWKWEKRSSAQAKTALDDFVTLRGRIAHRVFAATSIRKTVVTEALTLVRKLVEKTEVAVAAHLTSALGAAPW